MLTRRSDGLFLDADADDGVWWRTGVEAVEDGPGGEIEPVHMRRLVVGHPERAVAGQIETGSRTPLAGNGVRTHERARGIQARDDLAARNEHTAVGQHAEIVALSAW
jgi:hypothetical protein